MSEPEALWAFAFSIRAYRHERDLSLRGLAKETGVSPAALSRIEQGKGCRMETFDALCRQLGISRDDALDVVAAEEWVCVSAQQALR